MAVRHVQLGKGVFREPQFAAVDDGGIVHHVQRGQDVATVGPDRVDVAQADLITHAQTLSFTQLQVAANHLVEVIDPDTADQLLEKQLAEQERQAWAAAEFTGQYGADGIARGRFALPNLTFGMLKKHLDALSAPLPAGVGLTPADTSPIASSTRG